MYVCMYVCIYIYIELYNISYTVSEFQDVLRCLRSRSFSNPQQPQMVLMTQTSDDIGIHRTEALGTSMRETNMDSACSNSFQSL